MTGRTTGDVEEGRQQVQGRPRGRVGRRVQGDGGQAVTWFVLVGLLAMGMLAMKIALPLAEGGDRLGKGQTASEAAALAGAQDIADHVVENLFASIADESDLFHQIGDGCAQVGRRAAEQYAASNDTVVEDYCYDFPADRVRVKVRSVDPTSTGRRVSVISEAKTGLPWGDCRFDARPTPSTTSPTPTPTPSPTGTATPTPTPTTPPPPPPDLPLGLHCGHFTFHFMIDGTTGSLRLTPPGQLDGLLEPRLVR